MKRHILEINEANVDITDIYYIIRAKGQTSSGGYSDPELVFKKNGSIDTTVTDLVLDFIADDEHAFLTMLSPIQAELKLERSKFPNLKSVTIIAETNKKTITLK